MTKARWRWTLAGAALALAAVAAALLSSSKPPVPQESRPTNADRASALTPAPEPDLPTPEELKSISKWDARTAAPSARALLLDPKKAPALKLCAVERIKGLPAHEVVPVAVEFLESPSAPGSAYTKPSAVKLLADLRHPLAEDALKRLARSSADEHVRLAIAGLRAREMKR